MNYRHAFHAGNFADVVKHVVLTRLVAYLTRKEKPFRVIDTHAGTGLYDLDADEARRTGEWQGGIARVVHAKFEPDVADLLKPYLDAVAAVNPAGGLAAYPGSPMLVRYLLRRQDRLTAVELHPNDAATLRRRFAGDQNVRVLDLDGWLALGAHLPPKEKRGLVLIDPPFEQDGEYDRIVDGLARAHRRWPSGLYAIWYPLKDRAQTDAFRAALVACAIPRVLDCRVMLRPWSPEPRLDGTGMIVVNPPFVLEAELRTLLPALATALGASPDASWSLDWLAGEGGA
jgi:23S rRNA (adenine2030-N6)-methyltransferase